MTFSPILIPGGATRSRRSRAPLRLASSQDLVLLYITARVELDLPAKLIPHVSCAADFTGLVVETYKHIHPDLQNHALLNGQLAGGDGKVTEYQTGGYSITATVGHMEIRVPNIEMVGQRLGEAECFMETFCEFWRGDDWRISRMVKLGYIQGSPLPAWLTEGCPKRGFSLSALPYAPQIRSSG